MADSIQYEVLENNQIRFEEIIEELQKNQKEMEGRIDVNAQKLEEAVAGMEAKILDFMQRMMNKENAVGNTITQSENTKTVSDIRLQEVSVGVDQINALQINGAPKSMSKNTDMDGDSEKEKEMGSFGPEKDIDVKESVAEIECCTGDAASSMSAVESDVMEGIVSSHIELPKTIDGSGITQVEADSAKNVLLEHNHDNLYEEFDFQGEGDQETHLVLVLESLRVIENPKILTQDFKDYKILKSSFCLDLGNAEVTRPLEGVEERFDNNEPEFDETYEIVVLLDYATLHFPSVELPEKVRLAVDAILLAGKADEDTQDVNLDEYDVLTKVTDTTAAQATKGNDIQGILWGRLNITRDDYRTTRILQYQNYENLPQSSETVDKECKPIENGGEYYQFFYNSRVVKPTTLHFQLRNLVWATSKHDVYLISSYSILHWSSILHRLSDVLNFARHIAPTEKHAGNLLEGFTQTQISTMAVSDRFMVAGDFQGEIICKCLDKSGVSFCTRATYEDDAITNTIEMDTLVVVWNLATGEMVQTLKGHKLQVTGVTLDGPDIVSSSVDCTLRRWRKSQQVEAWEAHKSAVQAIVKLPSRKLVTSSSDMTLKLWKGRSCMHTYVGHTNTVRCLAIMPSLRIISASHDGSIRLWALSGQLLMEMVGHTSIVYYVDCHVSGLIVSGSEYCFAKIWKDGVCIQSIEHPSCVWDTKLLKNGNVVTAYSDGVVRIWTVQQDKIADLVELESYASLVSQHKLSRKRVGGLKLDDLPGLEALDSRSQGWADKSCKRRGRWRGLSMEGKRTKVGYYSLHRQLPTIELHSDYSDNKYLRTCYP